MFKYILKELIECKLKLKEEKNAEETLWNVWSNLKLRNDNPDEKSFLITFKDEKTNTELEKLNGEIVVFENENNFESKKITQKQMDLRKNNALVYRLVRSKKYR